MYGTELEEVELLVEKNVARILGESKYAQGFVSQEEEGEKVRMKFLTPTMEYFSRWLLSLGNAAEIILPLKLKDLMRENINELSSHYK